MDQATIEAIIKTTLEVSKEGFDWKLAFAGISAITALVSVIGVVISNFISYKKTKMELSHQSDKEWGKELIGTFSNLDGKDREMIKETKSLAQNFKLLSRKIKKDNLSPEEQKEAYDKHEEYAKSHDEKMVECIREHGILLTKFKLLFDPDSNEHKVVLKNLDNYEIFFLKRLKGDESENTRGLFDAYTNELCKVLGHIIHKNIKTNHKTKNNFDKTLFVIETKLKKLFHSQN